MSMQLVQAALQDAAKTALGSIPVVFENQAITPPANSKWAEVYFRNNDVTAFTMGSSGEDICDGILIVNIRYPKGSGSKAAQDDFETLRAAFPRGSKPTSDWQTVVIKNSHRTTSTVDDWYIMSFIVSWYAFLPP